MLSRPSNKLLPRQSGVSVTGSIATPTNSPQSSDTVSSQNAASADPTSLADTSTPLDLSTGVPSQLLSSSSVSSASSSTSPVFTTTTPPTTTSVSQPQSTTQQRSSSAPTSSSESPTSSHPSTSAPGTTSSNTPATTSPPQTTSHPPGSTSPSGTPTTITSTYITNINGSQVATQTIIPTTIPSIHSNTSSNRTLTIAGSAAGAAVLLIAILSIAFCARRKRFKRLKFLDAITSRRKQARSRATLLAGEDLDDVGLAQRPPGRYSDYETPWDVSQRSRAVVSRSSETGSVFREDVWPPPSESSRLTDPLAQSMSIDLQRIVDDVMGPSTEAAHFSQHSISSSRRGSADEYDGGRGELGEHSRTWSNGSQVALLGAAGLDSPAGASSTAPVRSSPLAQVGTKLGSEAHKDP
ncbi:hypothetical protein PAXRUDRAFT_835101 [Paxillus rubicundulus Ve08.2h10]|uniref:Uncharacterized protein n=1 Tax=Paxillus rubicundulus Ve08.2h10 TaxID=930991 RepID=A0A0D0C1N8_9AGAM|nr:hypothetical protein PAXRUDRAFT_835101 [Paxillus rubicundulus Ve08.2h10]